MDGWVGGKRYAMKNNHVEYLGWSFDMGHRWDTGARLFNVRYKGVRVAYEIGLAEAFTAYSGVQDILQATAIYADSIWGLTAFEQVKGVDVPSSATCRDWTFNLASSSTLTYKNAVCVFESNDGTPIRRHYEEFEEGFFFQGGLMQTTLVVRLANENHSVAIYIYSHFLY